MWPVVLRTECQLHLQYDDHGSLFSHNYPTGRLQYHLQQWLYELSFHTKHDRGDDIVTAHLSIFLYHWPADSCHVYHCVTVFHSWSQSNYECRHLLYHYDEHLWPSEYGFGNFLMHPKSSSESSSFFRTEIKSASGTDPFLLAPRCIDQISLA